MSVAVLLLTGTVGAGKTTILREIGEVLRLAEVAHARIDLDWLSYAQPPPGSAPATALYGRFGSDLAVQNLSAIWPNYAARGITRLALARALDEATMLTGLAAAIPECTITVCRLVAPAEVIAARVAMRELGLARPFLVQLAVELEHRATELTYDHYDVLNHCGRSVTDVATEVLERAGWLADTETGGDTAVADERSY